MASLTLAADVKMLKHYMTTEIYLGNINGNAEKTLGKWSPILNEQMSDNLNQKHCECTLYRIIIDMSIENKNYIKKNIGCRQLPMVTLFQKIYTLKIAQIK